MAHRVMENQGKTACEPASQGRGGGTSCVSFSWHCSSYWPVFIPWRSLGMRWSPVHQGRLSPWPAVMVAGTRAVLHLDKASIDTRPLLRRQPEVPLPLLPHPRVKARPGQAWPVRCCTLPDLSWTFILFKIQLPETVQCH